MVSSYFVLLILSQLLKPAVGLQVTPNSACAKLCINDPTTDVSDPNSSSTNGSDIVCTNDAYSDTAIGQKFKSCVNCLQNSTANATNENDQEWFLYNVRYAFNTCLYNSKAASEAFSTPCSISTVCGPLATSFQTGMDDPSVASQFSYCGANNETMGTNAFRDCTNCIKQSPDQLYLANMLIALDAGCIQRPKPGVLLGLDGSIFSSSRINITSPVTITTPTKKKILTIAAICGIAAGGIVAIFMLIAAVFIYYRKRSNRQNSLMRSSFDERYGNKDITNPVYGGYATYNELSPHTPTAYESVGLIKVPPPIKTSVLHDKFNPPEYEGYYAQRESPPLLAPHPPPAGAVPRKTHEELARDLGFSMGVQHPSPPPVETRVVPMLYQPDHSFQHAEYTPSEFSFLPSRTDTPDTVGLTRTTHLNRLSPFTAISNKTSPPQSGSTNFSVSTAPGLPSLPKRSPSFSSQNSTSNSASRNFSRRHTRDLSSSRGDMGAGGAGKVRPGQISGPMVSVGTRYEDEEEDAKMRRERLYREGFVKRQDEAQRRRVSYESDDELW